MGVRDAKTLARAADLGTAMQLTNIARDVGEDAHLGRIYLPMDELKAEGVDPAEMLANPTYSDGIGVVTKRLLERADWLYKRADHGIAHLPRKYQPGIRAARKLYAAIGQKVSEHNYNSVDQRAIVDTGKKFALLTSAIAFAQPRSNALNTPALPQNQFLVDAVVASGSAAPAIKTDPFKVRTLWIIDLFETLRERDRDARIARIR
jgi:phytoene synthase